MELAIPKREALLVTDSWKFEYPEIELSGVKIQWKDLLTYLGVELDRRLSFASHVEKVTRKAVATGGSLTRVLPNIEAQMK